MNMNVKNKFSLSLLSLCIGLSSAITFTADARDITIYYTNDLHAHVTPGIIPSVSKTREVGGFAPISKIVKDAKEKDKGTGNTAGVSFMIVHYVENKSFLFVDKDSCPQEDLSFYWDLGLSLENCG